jgi:transcriptional regulator with XRE-family HTH domain
VPRQRTRESITDALPLGLEEQGVSARELARQIGINQGYVSLVLGVRRAPSRKILISASKALGLPADYFREARQALVLEKIKADPRILDRIYDLVRGRGQIARRS